ncbi:MAG: class IV adenylate cyclase [Methanopyri archaeon]|nr:class IV adenylate cyclase [Methanopyri archaeon]
MEVEIKVRVDDPERVEEILSEEGEHVRTLRQEDVYFSHPCRDFAETDEALRLREVETEEGSTCILTYKGPKIGDVGKSRVEIEVEVSDREAAREILERLGFEPLEDMVIRKVRKVYALHVDGTRVEACLDTVEGLGTFLEVEIEAEEDADVDELEAMLLELVRDRLGVRGEVVRDSYLELLMRKEGVVEDGVQGDKKA